MMFHQIACQSSCSEVLMKLWFVCSQHLELTSSLGEAKGKSVLVQLQSDLRAILA